jgi:hypothetical protein
MPGRGFCEAGWNEHSDATMREGLEECFTFNRLNVPPSQHRCLANANFANPHSGVGRRGRFGR